MLEVSDKKLVTSYLKGDEKALETFYLRYERMLYGYIYRKVRNSDVTQDLFQEIWMKIVKNMGKLGTFSQVKSWVFRIAHNHIIDYYRKEGRRKGIYSMNNPVDSSGEGHSTFEDMLSDPQVQHPLQKLRLEEFEQCLDEALLTLSEEQREVFSLRYEKDLKFKDIAEITQAPLNTVLGRMRTAVRKITDFFKNKGVLEDERL